MLGKSGLVTVNDGIARVSEEWSMDGERRFFYKGFRNPFQSLFLFQKMSESDSDSGSCLERVISGTAPKLFNLVPNTEDFKLKFFGSQCARSGTKLVFQLKEGKPLPYRTTTITKKGKGMWVHINFDEKFDDIFSLQFLVSPSPGLFHPQPRVTMLKKKVTGGFSTKVSYNF